MRCGPPGVVPGCGHIIAYTGVLEKEGIDRSECSSGGSTLWDLVEWREGKGMGRRVFCTGQCGVWCSVRCSIAWLGLLFCRFFSSLRVLFSRARGGEGGLYNSMVFFIFLSSRCEVTGGEADESFFIRLNVCVCVRSS